MSECEPGTVAVATVRGVEGVRVMAGYGTSEPRLRWRTTDARLVDVHNDGWYFAFDVTDVRPLVVLDWHPNQSDLPTLLTLLRDNYWTSLADQIEAQTRPRTPEPGLWAVVRAARREIDGSTDKATGVWLRTDHLTCPWTHDSGNWTANWDDLIDPTLIREGVE